MLSDEYEYWGIQIIINLILIWYLVLVKDFWTWTIIVSYVVKFAKD
jgi:hypothetical protein